MRTLIFIAASLLVASPALAQTRTGPNSQQDPSVKLAAGSIPELAAGAGFRDVKNRSADQKQS